jgi:two-component system nitrate/nitrite response regulator NarL
VGETKANGVVRVVVADDHPVFRAGLATAIRDRAGLELVAEADNGRSALEKIRRLSPDVAVLDLKMPGLDGLEVLRAALREHLESRIIFLSGYIHGETVYEAVEAGAAGYLTKDSRSELICDAIVAVASGEMVLGPGTHDAIADEIRLRTPAEPTPLSEREREILALAASGKSATEIADQLFLSPATVKTHLQRVYQKLSVSGRAAAVAEALRRGLLE